MKLWAGRNCGAKLRRRRPRALALAWLLAALLSPAAALNPNLQISQYAHTAWRIQDGVFRGTPNAITQTRDGYLWIGTEAGLLRFDGVQFAPWIPPAGQALPTAAIASLLAARDGSLWIGTKTGLAHWAQGKLTILADAGGFIESMVEDSQGVWLVRSQIRDGRSLCQVSGDSVHCYGSEDGMPFPYAQALAWDGEENLWIGSSLGLCRWKAQACETHLPPALKVAQGLAGVSSILAGPQELWVGIKRSGPGLGLQQFAKGQWKDIVLPGFRGSNFEVNSLFQDRDGALWVGTTGQGIYRLAAGRAENFGSMDGLTSDAVTHFFQDREGNLWIVTNRGIDRLRDFRVTTFSKGEGLTTEDAGSVVAARDGTVWIGNARGLNLYRDGKLSAIEEGHGLPGRLVTALLEDHAGRLWMGIDRTLAVYEQGRFRPIAKPDGSPLGIVRALAEDIHHHVWVSVTQPALFRIEDFQVREEIGALQIPRTRALAAAPDGGVFVGLSDGNFGRFEQGRFKVLDLHAQKPKTVRNLLAEKDGSVWISKEDGLVLWKEGQVQTLSSRNGLPCDSVFAAIRDQSGALWLDAECGFVSIAAAELEKWRKQPQTQVNVLLLDVFDGAQPALTNFGPQAALAPDGKLWFVNDTVVQMVDPGRLARNEIQPPVHIQQIIADRKGYSPGRELHFPALTHDIQIDYTALSLVMPERVRFRYRLEGHDTDWQEPEGRRQAFYSELPPGHYKFRVIASNNDGVWNETGAAQEFTIAPAFFQSKWFYLSSALSAAGLLWLFYTLRVRQLAGQLQARLEERLQERERIARDLHDTLLQGIFSAAIELEIAEDRLPANSEVKPLLQHVLEIMRKVGNEGRNTIRSLRSTRAGTDGLEESLSQIQKQFLLQKDVAFHVAAEGEPRPLSPLVRDEIYSIGREAVVNAFRHARARRIEVEVEYTARYFRLQVRDNGSGIDGQTLLTGREGHWGLAGMRERAEKIGARFEVLSRVGSGTDVELSLPGRIAYESAAATWFPAWFAQLWKSKNVRNWPPDNKRESRLP
ncbi:MAG: hypothetical protein JST79_05380 [Acidobacteria bacterium]|nr:hypothetical protein [Acidobacteriota bacterium]